MNDFEGTRRNSDTHWLDRIAIVNNEKRIRFLFVIRRMVNEKKLAREEKRERRRIVTNFPSSRYVGGPNKVQYKFTKENIALQFSLRFFFFRQRSIDQKREVLSLFLNFFYPVSFFLFFLITGTKKSKLYLIIFLLRIKISSSNSF